MGKSIRHASQEDKDQIFTQLTKMAEEGTTLQAAFVTLQEGSEYDLSLGTVKRWCTERGIRFDPAKPTSKVVTPPPPPTKQELTQIVVLERKVQDLSGRLSLTQRKYKEVQKQELLADRLIAEALPAITTLKPVEPAVHAIKSKQTHSPQDAVCHISCLHMGEFVDKAATDGHGEFSPELACARVQYYVDSVLDLVFNHHQGERIDTLWLVDVGDNASGMIHEELNITNAFNLGEQMVRTAHLLSFAVRDLAAHFRRVVFVGTVGNHMRFVRKPAFKEKVHNNGDWVIYQHMKALLADQKNVEFIIPDAPWANLDIQGHQFFFSHGDAIRMYMQFPWYDTARFVSQMGQLIVSKSGIKKYPEYWGFGQFHQANTTQLSYGRWMFTGSAKGPDEYSINKLRAGTPATWLFYGVHRRRGRSFYYEIDMMSAKPNVQDRYLSAVTI